MEGIQGMKTTIQTIQCPLCGMHFEPDEEKKCKGCPIQKNCGLVCCPNCGYQMPKESRLAEWVRRLLKG
ncbi:MAG: hypothetical protein C4520_10795 [Candidatus Abyssobacteria bacterium SURF_5]|uniref:DNA helicase PriA n=1 Tax=Abyssobacteria bacterium (strain SURF_5) TaxID=2093360 RepID=A0A3A4NUQ3_ABYX5|nr:MAG: hypothetical protein C4520_10795 [Candidatus Abyssubacteria bacterium SURF_5]